MHTEYGVVQDKSTRSADLRIQKYTSKTLKKQFKNRIIFSLFQHHAILAVMNISIPIVLGTGRKDRQSEKVARFVYAKLNAFEGIQTELVDVKDHLVSPFTIPAWVEDENASKWRKIAQNAHGFVFVVPEYNRSFPGEFKLLFDSAFKEYKGKPAIIVGVSSGQYGGVRVIQQLAPVLLAASIETLGTTVATSHVKELFADEVPTNETYIQFVEDALTALVTKLK